MHLCNAGKTYLRNDLQCDDGDAKTYALTHVKGRTVFNFARGAGCSRYLTAACERVVHSAHCWVLTGCMSSCTAASVDWISLGPTKMWRMTKSDIAGIGNRTSLVWMTLLRSNKVHVLYFLLYLIGIEATACACFLLCCAFIHHNPLDQCS